MLGYGRCFAVIEKWVPESVVRGIQLGLALLLFKASMDFVIKDSFFFVIGITIIVAFILLIHYKKVPDLSSICVIAVGVIGGIILHGIPPLSLIPPPALVIPLPTDFPSALSTLVPPQVALTIANAILATSLLTKDLFGKDVPPKKLSTTIGLMNIVSVPFGGFPMCHGAGGLAGSTVTVHGPAGQALFAGLIFIILALFFTSPQVLSIVAVGVLGALLVFVGIEMGRHSLRTDSLALTLVIGVLALAISMTVAFIIGIAAAYVLIQVKKRQAQKGSAA